MSALSIRLMGAFQVTLKGDDVTDFESDKARALLAFLAVEAAQAHRRTRLAGMLWPNSTEQAARTNLRHVLSNLRRAIGDRRAKPPFLQISRQTIQFSPTDQVEVDVTRFSALIAEPNHTQPERLAEAVNLYQGPFLDGFSLADSSDFEEWLLVTREQLARRMLETLKRLSDYYESKRDYHQALPYVWRWLELDPWQERAYQSVMRLLAQTGQRSLAVVQYETCCRILATELGVEPSPETVALYQEILNGPLDGANHSHQPASPLLITPEPEAFSAPPHNLPTQLTSFVGRQTEIAQLRQRLIDPDCHLLSLIGLGGMGKTRLAIELGRTFLEPTSTPTPFADGIYFVSLASLDHPDELVSAIAEAIDFHFQEGPEPKAQLLAYLSHKAILLILDNFEHLLAGATEITELLLAAPRLKVLITSRASLNLHEEWRYPVTGLTLPDSSDDCGPTSLLPEETIAFSAVQLFEQRASQVQPHFDLAQEIAAVIDICRLLGGLPLAIELAAAWTKTLACTAIVQEIEQTLAFLATTQRNIPQRHRSLRAVFEHSWQLLSPLAQQTLARLTVFPGSFAQQAGLAITEAPLITLHSLIEMSLVQGQTSGRYQLHPLFREFASEKLADDAQEQAAALARHSHFYLAWLQPMLVRLQRATAESTAKQIATDFENARLAITWPLKQGDVAVIDGALDSLFFFLMTEGRYQAGGRLAALVYQATLVNHAAPDLIVKIKGAIWHGFFQHHLGEIEAARQALAWGLAQLTDPILENEDTRSLEALATLFLANLEFDSDRVKTKQLIDRSLHLYQSLGDPWGEAEAWLTLGWFVKFAGEAAEAKAAFEKSLALRQALGRQASIAQALSSLAHHLIGVSTDSFDLAEQYVQESLRLRQQSNRQPDIAEAFASMGEVGMWGGKFADAAENFQRSIDLLKSVGANDNDLATRQMSLGFVKMHLGDYQAALKQADLSLTMAERLQSQFVVAFSHFLQGCTALALQDLAGAEQALQSGHSRFQTLNQVDEIAGLQMVQAMLAIHGGKAADAGSIIQAALQLAVPGNMVRAMYYAVPAVALYFCQSQPVLAIEIYEAGRNNPHVAHSHWFADVAGKWVEAQAAQLPADTISAAKARGRNKPRATLVAEMLDWVSATITL